LIYSDDRVIIPHKEVANRDFVLVPLCEIAPDLIHPVLNKKICDIVIENEDKYILEKFSNNLIKIEEFKC
jgi:7,8-dihydro-6-hydroxymethylpterin-pyrophosphokinase